jgi:hypothetical protein
MTLKVMVEVLILLYNKVLRNFPSIHWNDVVVKMVKCCEMGMNCHDTLKLSRIQSPGKRSEFIIVSKNCLCSGIWAAKKQVFCIDGTVAGKCCKAIARASKVKV